MIIHEVMKALTFQITNMCDPAEKHFEQCPSLRSRLSQGDIKRMEKLEDRREEKRVADLQANQQMMMQMMQNMFQQSNLHQQSQPPNPLLSMRLSFPPVTRTSSNQATTTSISTSQSDSDADALVASIDKANLETADSERETENN